MTTKTVANGLFRPELWSKLLLRDIMDYGVMLDCVNRNYEGEVKNQGDTVHIQAIGDVTINTHDDTEAMTYETLSGSTDTLVINQAKDFGFVVKDIDKVQANVEYMTKFTNKAKKKIVNTKDAYLHTTGFSGVASGNQMGNIDITASNIYDTCVDLFTLLSDANAIDANGLGEDGKRPWLVLPPAMVAVVKKSAEVKHATVLGDKTVRKGSILEFAGFDIRQSTLVKGTTAGGKVGYKILCGTTEAITYAEQITKVESVKDKDFFGDFVRGLYLYGAKVVQPSCLASATFKVTAPST